MRYFLLVLLLLAVPLLVRGDGTFEYLSNVNPTEQVPHRVQVVNGGARTLDSFSNVGCTIFTNTSTTQTYTLPAAEVGMCVTIIDILGGGTISIEVDNADAIIYPGLSLDNGDQLDSPGTQMDLVQLVANIAGDWMVMGNRGTWTDGGP